MIDQYILVIFLHFEFPSFSQTRYPSIFARQQPHLTSRLFLAKYMYALVWPNSIINRPFPGKNTLLKVEKIRDVWQNMQDFASFLSYFYAIHSKSIIVFHYGSSTMESEQSWVYGSFINVKADFLSISKCDNSFCIDVSLHK